MNNVTRNTIFNRNICCVDPIYLDRSIPFVCKVWFYFKAVILAHPTYCNLTIRPWWNQSNQGSPFFVFLAFSDSLEDKKDFPPFCNCVEDMWCLVWHLNLLWEEYIGLRKKGYKCIRHRHDVTASFYKVALSITKNKLLTEIIADITGFIHEFENGKDPLIYGFADCMIHSPTVKIAFSKKTSPNSLVETLGCVPMYSRNNNGGSIDPPIPIPDNHPVFELPSINIRVIYDNKEEDIDGKKYNLAAFRLIRYRLDSIIYINKSFLIN